MSTQPASKSRLTRKQQFLAVVCVAALSTVIALALEAAQEQHLGDQPGAMIVWGCSLAVLTGALRLGRPILLGLASMAGFPVAALIDLALHGGHNMLPIEFLFYGFYAVPGVIAAAIAWRVAVLIANTRRR
jgi:hypothetical protein